MGSEVGAASVGWALLPALDVGGSRQRAGSPRSSWGLGSRVLFPHPVDLEPLARQVRGSRSDLILHVRNTGAAIISYTCYRGGD